MISLTIDGKNVEVPEGTTVLRAAEAAGISIPTLCDHPKLTPYGGCRLCLVEVEGARTLQTSCTLPVTNGMVVKTDTVKLHEARKFVLTLLFSERNHFCMYCQMSGGDCELQNSAYAEDMTHWPLQPSWASFPVDASHKDFVFDHNRCILCRRCIRACGELVGNYTLGARDRGAKTMVVADLDVPMGESTCISCGNCLQVCPTGSLIDRASAYKGREKDVEFVESACAGCSVGCGIKMVVRNNQLVRIEGNWSAPVNEGILCEVGRFTPLHEDRERIVTPLVRKNGALKAATWEEALGVVAGKIKPLTGRNNDGVAALASTRLSAEALYAFKQLFADKIGSGMVTSIEEGTTTLASSKAARLLNKPFEGSLEDLKQADCVVAVGVDLVKNHQVAGFFVKRALEKGLKLIVIDPFENGLQEFAHYNLQPKKGTDNDLLLGIMAGMINQGLAKAEPKNLPNLAKNTPEAASQTTGVAPDVIRAVGRIIATAQKTVFVYGKGISLDGSKALETMIELASLANASLIGTKGQTNSMSAALLGFDDQFELNGHQAVYLAMGDDYPSQRLLKKLEKAPFVAVQASYVSQVTALADVVLPVEMWAEQDGHFINLDGHIQEAHHGLQAAEGIKGNATVLTDVAEKLGFKLDGNWKQEIERGVKISSLK
jgi:formate dehydrogenase major subunit